MLPVNPVNDEEKIEKLISCLWQSVLSKCLYEQGHAVTLRILKQSNSALEFATRCSLLTLDSKKLNSEQSEETAQKADDRHPLQRVRAFHTIDRLFRLRRTVVIVGGNFKPVDSMHITFVQAQGFNVINLVDQLHYNPADWSQVGLIFLLTDVEWALHGSFTTFEKLMGRLCLKAPDAKICVTKIPILGTEQINLEKTRRLKNFNYSLARLCRYSCSPITMWHLESFVEEVAAQPNPKKPYYLNVQSSQQVMTKLVKRIENMATRLRRVSPNDSTFTPSIVQIPKHVIKIEDLEKKLVGKALAKQNATRR
ncbi:hypothetical protein M3Y96_00272100 [Aphelenchoides besseyi]|nr:hypothetical protein M3Y96_00272100 [Aphelenchoides besseyi]